MSESEPFQSLFVLLYLLTRHIQGGRSKMVKIKLGLNDCPYCAGKGYFQLLLGGSETCDCCQGTGEKEKKDK